ncbi:hypothetical protein [Rhodococcus aetherivorans]|uniref:hypothetical protein n=1 Tax=Rhodococcus aetherivorans TaxID=191292 RepID=UPI0029496BB6|nr:hypothetical protein [Rhodococcus aetherivorans]MDV6297249.1 hypothetical protein [Rhodococcus aetherivorans]
MISSLSMPLVYICFDDFSMFHWCFSGAFLVMSVTLFMGLTCGFSGVTGGSMAVVERVPRSVGAALVNRAR